MAPHTYVARTLKGGWVPTRVSIPSLPIRENGETLATPAPRTSPPVRYTTYYGLPCGLGTRREPGWLALVSPPAAGSR